MGSLSRTPASPVQLVPRKYERRTSRVGGTSGGLGRGGHARGFWTKVRIGHHPRGCWEWIGYLDKDGYGKFSTTAIGGKPRTYRAHRLAYEIEHGPAGDATIIHLCSNVRCVRPDHLTAGTQRDAIHNLIKNGRKAPAPDNRGELSPTAKLTDDDVLFIRAQPHTYGVIPVLAALYGVSRHTIAQIRYRRTWRHLGNGSRANAMSVTELRALLGGRQTSLTPDDYASARTGAA